MPFTQVELTGPNKQREVLWLPVPEKKAKVGEKIMRSGEPWTISAVCTTLELESIPAGHKVVSELNFQSETVYYMSI